MKYTYIYTHWSKQKHITEDFYNPILFSIATLREFSNDKILVINYSDTDWCDYDKKLNFKIIKKQPIEFGLSEYQNNVFSRNLHILEISKNIKSDIFVSVDSDIFWLDSVREISINKFHIKCGSYGLYPNKDFNNGCYCFGKEGDGNLFMEKYTNNIKRIGFEKIYWHGVKKYFYLNDESICHFTYNNNKMLCEQKDFLYNGPLMNINEKKWNYNYKNIHLLHNFIKKELDKRNRRSLHNFCGLIALLISEVNDILKKTLPCCLKNFNFEKTKFVSINQLAAKGSTDELFDEFVNFCRVNFNVL